MKTLIAAACLLAVAGIGLLIVTSNGAEAGKSDPLALSALPATADAPVDGHAEQYRRLHDLRMHRIADLEAYAKAGSFPQNDYSISDFTPVFVDGAGTACAVGHLMRCAGATGLVDTVAAESRFVKLHEIQIGPVVDWILTSGLTKEECELIQPSYPWKTDPPPDKEPDMRALERLAGDPESVTFIRHHLLATARKLRKDTPLSLQLALQRLGKRTAGSFEIVNGASATTRVFHNDGGRLLVRATSLDDDGGISAIGAWHELSSGASFTLDAELLASGCLVEVRPARASP